jgi:hypothetical protein
MGRSEFTPSRSIVKFVKKDVWLSAEEGAIPHVASSGLKSHSPDFGFWFIRFCATFAPLY